MNTRLILLVLISLLIAGCNSEKSDKRIYAPGSLDGSSYSNFKNIGLKPMSFPDSVGGLGTIRGYGDFTGNGFVDLFTTTLTYWPPTTPDQATEATLEFWQVASSGQFTTVNIEIIRETSACIHPRKNLIADFNNDDIQDIYMICHGWDAPPYPGEKNKILLSQSTGTYILKEATSEITFYHGASAADINFDGTIDVIAVSNFDADTGIVLLNDGNGGFTRQASPSISPEAISGPLNYFSLELVDINKDGYADIITGGHEWEGAATSIFINPGNYDFSNVSPYIIPAVSNYGVVLDFTVTENSGSQGETEIWVLRSSGGDGTFYQGRVVQRVSWPSLETSTPLVTRDETWVPWLFEYIENGERYIGSENIDGGIKIQI